MSTAKIFNFESNDNLKKDINPNKEDRPMGVPELLKSCQRIAEKRLHALMDTMFNNADDCLFEYADKAANNEQQTVYMDAMRELRVKKAKMQEAFFSEFGQQFAAQLMPSAKGHSAHSTAAEADSGLTLLDEEVLEESLAVTNMAGRVYSDYREPLAAMVIRMNEVYPEAVFNKEGNPLSPTIICSAFSKSVACLDTELEIKLIVYKLFDKFVMRKIGQLYHDINKEFIAAGVLPTIKYKMPAIKDSDNSIGNTKQVSVPADTEPAQSSDQSSVQSPAQAPVKPPVTQPPQPQARSSQTPNVDSQRTPVTAANVFDTMRQALYQVRGDPLPANLPQGSVEANKNSQGSAASVAAPNGPDAQTETGGKPGNNLYYVTSDIVAGLSSIQNNRAIASFHAGSKNSGEVIKNKVLQAVVQSNHGGEEKTFHNSDADIIDIVSMMFDYILNDKSLPERTKTVIARLQIPMVKVAILDRTFFSKKNHPARALLNELAYASNVLDSEYDDADTLFEEVERVVERVLEKFDDNIELFSELLEEFLTFLATEVKANQLAEQMVLDTKQKVVDEIEQRLRRHKIPAAVRRFILGPWKDVMNVIGVRDHCEGIAWNTATTFLDDLIWSVQPKLFGDDRKQLSRLIPRILPSIREGLALLDDNNFDVPAFLQELQQLHLKAMHVNQSGSRSSNRDSFMAELMDEVQWQENKHDQFEFDMNDPKLQQSPYFTTVSTMTVGTWVEFKSEHGANRGKLTWKCDFTGEYTFVNRMYKMIADVTMRELIAQLDSGSARIVEDVPLFDRAVDAIISSVKQMTGGGGQGQPAVN